MSQVTTTRSRRISRLPQAQYLAVEYWSAPRGAHGVCVTISSLRSLQTRLLKLIASYLSESGRFSVGPVVVEPHEWARIQERIKARVLAPAGVP